MEHQLGEMLPWNYCEARREPGYAVDNYRVLGTRDLTPSFQRPNMADKNAILGLEIRHILFRSRPPSFPLETLGIGAALQTSRRIHFASRNAGSRVSASLALS